MQKHGHKVMHKAVGGIIASAMPTMPSVGVRLSKKPKGLPMSLITKMKMQNNVPGMACGGKVKK